MHTVYAPFKIWAHVSTILCSSTGLGYSRKFSGLQLEINGAVLGNKFSSRKLYRIMRNWYVINNTGNRAGLYSNFRHLFGRGDLGINFLCCIRLNHGLGAPKKAEITHKTAVRYLHHSKARMVAVAVITGFQLFRHRLNGSLQPI